ncbi:UvrD/REP helicase [Methanosalsum zhilinae DSM 4017]|uniref:DNA 3'-5' helicase n=1 Tax=Methanosalsum zhilinae (strain DSM 4017 / NBRC 107636 / OCM 62 / WeN5) TaxID=679901 RepID=F7XMX6_METZD|nr:ATP-dependent DNA helicase [Methanosalsum zhilinae]AEH59994.1 UvrD/REP helicase [Methanosalsum zhilinae DSM 4017]
MEDIGLTEQQKEAIEYIDSPLLIVAGPGTGKTRVLTEKVIYLVKQGYNPNKIIVSTFTIKAADELRNRLRKDLGDSVENMQISTIHSFCQKMLQSFPEYHNFGNIFEVMDDLDQFLYVNRNYMWNFGLKEYVTEISVNELINFYNRCTENDVDPKKLVDHFKKNKGSDFEIAIAKSYEIYLANLLDPNNTRLDFSLLEREFYHLLQRNNEVLELVRQMYDYILIDEYQDTNPIQDAIFELITAPKYKITVVGDEDQSIYGFRGASVENFRTFLDRYPNAKKIELEENFRSCKEIVQTYDEFMKPHRTFEKEIFTSNPEYSKPVILYSDSRKSEGKEIVRFVEYLVQKCNARYQDIAILFKSVKFHSSEIIDELEYKKIPYTTKGEGSLFEQEEIKNLLVLMIYINSHYPNEKQKQWLFDHNILESEFLDLHEDTIEKLKNVADIYNLLESYDYATLKKLNVEQNDAQKLMGLKDLMTLQKRNSVSQLKLFYKILDATQYNYRLFKRYLEKKDADADIKIRNLAIFSKIIHKVENNTNSNHFKSFIDQLCYIPENKIEDAACIQDVDAVNLMTIHQAKGLEFPIVILAGVTHKRYNTNNQNDEFIVEIPKKLMMNKSNFNRSEEIRRVFYVGMSRPQKVLAISTIDGKYFKPSQFIDEIGLNNFIEADNFSQIISDNDHYIPNVEKSNLSFSSISTYISCPFRFFCRDYLGFQTPPGYFQAYGVIVHNCLKKIHVMMKEGKEIDITDVVKIVDMYCKDDESREEWRNELITDLYNYYEKACGFIYDVLDVEVPFSYINKNISINGQADLVIKNTNEEIELIDYKSRYAEYLSKMNVDTQLRIYNLALANRYNEPIKKISAYTFKDNRRIFFDNSNVELEKTKSLIKSIIQNVENKEFERNWEGPICKTKAGLCEFYQLCNMMEGDTKNGR